MEDVDYLRLIREKIESGGIKASLDLNKLEHMDSPISVQADSNRWIYPLIILVSAAGWFGGVWWAVGTAGAGAGAWYTVGKRWHRRRMEQRFHRLSLNQTAEWKKLWLMSGVVLTDTESGAQCASPSGNWRAFVSAPTNHDGAGQTRG